MNPWRNRPLPKGLVPVVPGSYIGHVVDGKTGCWLWTGGRDRGGYGVYSPYRAGKTGSAHTFYYRRAIGPVPKGLELDHTCRVRHCVNPAHLEPVTSAENKHRSSLVRLTAEEAADIQSRYAAGGVRMIDLAKAFSVSVGTVHKVVHSQHWRTREIQQ